MVKFKFPKKPKAPAASASQKQHDNYLQKIEAWSEKCREIQKAKEAHKAAQARTQSLKGITLAGVLSKTTKKKTTKKRR